MKFKFIFCLTLLFSINNYGESRCKNGKYTTTKPTPLNPPILQNVLQQVAATTQGFYLVPDRIENIVKYFIGPATTTSIKELISKTTKTYSEVVATSYNFYQFLVHFDQIAKNNAAKKEISTNIATTQTPITTKSTTTSSTTTTTTPTSATKTKTTTITTTTTTEITVDTKTSTSPTTTTKTTLPKSNTSTTTTTTLTTTTTTKITTKVPTQTQSTTKSSTTLAIITTTMGISPFNCQFVTGVRLNLTAISALIYIKEFNFSKISDTMDQCCYQCNVYMSRYSNILCDYFFENILSNGAYRCQMYHFSNRNHTFIYDLKQGFFYEPVKYSKSSGTLGYSNKFF